MNQSKGLFWCYKICMLHESDIQCNDGPCENQHIVIRFVHQSLIYHVVKIANKFKLKGTVYLPYSHFG